MLSSYTEAMRSQVDNTGLQSATYDDYGVSLTTGFVPAKGTPALPASLPEYIWEIALQSARNSQLAALSRLDHQGDASAAVASCSSWRASIRQLPIIARPSKALLGNDALLRRAHVVLCMLGHYYLHSLNNTSSVVVPTSIALPWIHIADMLGVKPVLSYTSEILWNWTCPTQILPASDTIEISETFTGHESEVAFDASSVKVELEGAPILAAIHRTFSSHFRLADVTDLTRAITGELLLIEETVIRMRRHISDLFSTCDPHHFYNVQRPWIAGSPPEGWTYDLGDDRNTVMHLRGSTAAASPLLQSLDAFLGLDHTGEHRSFREDVREYMPRGHRSFIQALSNISLNEVCSEEVRTQLEEVRSNSPVRALVLALSAPCINVEVDLAIDLQNAYNAVLKALTAFRTEHFKVVSLFVVSQAAKVKQLASTSKDDDTDTLQSDRVEGTGGSDLRILLNGYKKVTEQALFVAKT
ncbi:Indoleamine 2,3-dioxygenase [Elsinoe ampelina]|uniref:Indoleamine 2,3-dioxygenase n=1 Tax=Elsinoe ampelina TaxID=302913 RepID=A0A6A6GR10_9PEZI|nr:Indoleamine 2,3-dioxygenase [Elsinoe ampelina]